MAHGRLGVQVDRQHDRVKAPRNGWVEAVTRYPHELKIIWRVAGRGQLDEGFERIAQTLAQGYDNLAFDGVTIVEMTAPAGVRDLNS